MRNPNRTTKGERRFVRRYNRYASRALGVAQAARWHREGFLLDEARGFDNLVNDLKYGPVPLDLGDRVNAAIDAQRDALERKLGVAPGMLTATSSNSNNLATHIGYEVSDGPNPHITLKYPPHTSFVASVPYRNGAHQADATFGALYQAYREGRERGDAVEWHELAPGEWEATVAATRREPAIVTIPESLGGGTFEVPHGDAEYAAWDGDPWHDPNEVAAVHAEAIENALNDDIEPGEQ